MARTHQTRGRGVLDLIILGDIFEGRYNSHSSDLVYARTHAELAGRTPRPLSEGLNLREPLNTKDYANWE